MKAVFRTIVTGIACLIVISFASAQVPQFSPFTADLQITSTADRAPRDMTAKIFVGSGHMRMNMQAIGGDTAMITTFATKTVDIVMPQQQMYMEYKASDTPRGPAAGTQDLKPFDPENPCANQPDITCKKIGTEEGNGRTCDHWEITDKNGKISNVWIDQNLHFPIKLVTQNSTLTLTNIQEGEPAASLFEIPAGYRKMDMSGLVPRNAGSPPQK